MAETKTFTYTAVDGNGKTVTGRVDAASSNAAVAQLRRSGVVLTAIDESSGGTGLNREINIPAFAKRVKPKDLAVMARQMATMISSGMSKSRMRRGGIAPPQGLIRPALSSMTTLSPARARSRMISDRFW